MSEHDNRQPEKEDKVEKQVEKAQARKHEVRWSYVFLFFLLMASVGITIYIIEIYQ